MATSVGDLLYVRTMATSVGDLLYFRSMSTSVRDLRYFRSMAASVRDLLYFGSMATSVRDLLYFRSVATSVRDLLYFRSVATFGGKGRGGRYIRRSLVSKLNGNFNMCWDMVSGQKNASDFVFACNFANVRQNIGVLIDSLIGGICKHREQLANLCCVSLVSLGNSFSN